MTSHQKNDRRTLVRYARELWKRRLVSGTSGNLSVRLKDGSFLVTPSQHSLRNLRGDELLRVDGAGVPLDSRGTPSSELAVHLMAYSVRLDIAAVVHTHPTFCVVWSSFGRVFPRETVGARETLGEVAWTPYAPPGTQELANITATEFARGVNTVLMENHGLTTIGVTLEDAFVLSDLAEETARVAYWSGVSPLGGANPFSGFKRQVRAGSNPDP
ncbi:MAG: class II aldolase/adducin family protein [Candidatus Eremiobacteraeota bacterium]|nr:class II aldolase/adducin family protein [Candidatus Eremiobacteraeota bacterium]